MPTTANCESQYVNEVSITRSEDVHDPLDGRLEERSELPLLAQHPLAVLERVKDVAIPPRRARPG